MDSKVNQPTASVTPESSTAPSSGTATPTPNTQAGASPAQTAAPVAPQQQVQHGKYAHLLQVIEEMGRDIRPTYAGNKMAAERLKKNIHTARILVRECAIECERMVRS